MNPTSKPVTIRLGDRDVKIHFNFNTYNAFHKRTGKFWMDWYFETLRRSQKAILSSQVFERIRDEDLPAQEIERLLTEQQLTGAEAMTVVSPDEMQAIIWAGAHRLVDGEVKHDFGYGEVGAMLGFDNYGELLGPILAGVRDNLPRAKKKAETEEPEAEPERPTKRTHQMKPKSGGAISGPSDSEILASVTRK